MWRGNHGDLGEILSNRRIHVGTMVPSAPLSHNSTGQKCHFFRGGCSLWPPWIGNKSRCQSTFGMRTRNYYVAMERSSFVKARNNELHTLITPASIRTKEGKIEKTFFRLILCRKWYRCARPRVRQVTTTLKPAEYFHSVIRSTDILLTISWRAINGEIATNWIRFRGKERREIAQAMD